ncbi:hypothetical protein OPIT5_22120 [Opitutaceae bacterium TAV5]|nr:hypothetical protein OPIT5_22120 [Opitutaceae bacterium TAV5]
MKLDGKFLSSPAGHLVLICVVLVIGVLVVRWQRQKSQTPPLPESSPVTMPAVPLPKTLTREGVRVKAPASPPSAPKAAPESTPDRDGLPETSAAPPATPAVLPLTLFAAKPQPAASSAPFAPYGRMIPCQTVVTLESNRLETPVIGLVTEDVWHDGKRIIPAGAEVHGRASLDRARERLAAEGAWHIVWRTPDAENGNELAVQGLALDRDHNPVAGQWGAPDGSAGLRGQVLRSDNFREIKFFAASFLSAATTALQDTRSSTGALGETIVPAATARNATLAGTAEVLREYARLIRESIERDGFYLRVPSGKPFYLYVTQSLDRSADHKNPPPASTATSHQP